MALYSDSKYKIFEITGLPPGLFGSVYVVAVSIHTSGDYFRGEHYVLTARSLALHIEKFRFSSTDLPPDFLRVDLEFILQEAKEQSQIFFANELEKRAIELKRPDLVALPFALEEISSPFVGFRLRGEFENEIIQIRNETECEQLSIYLGHILKISNRFTKDELPFD